MGADNGAIAATTDATEGSTTAEEAEAKEAEEAEAPPKYFGTLRALLPSWLATWQMYRYKYIV